MMLLNLAARLPLYWAFRATGRPRIYPFSLVVSVSYRCNSRCHTCGVWRRPNDDMTLEEWDQVFAHLGRTPFYMTFTGGEPFLRRDLDEVVISAYRHCRPSVITIPTNGLLSERVIEGVERICRACPDSQIGLNLSLDGLEDEHDRLRGIPGTWKRAMATWEGLKSLQPTHPNLVLSVHTVISRLNQTRFREIYDGLQGLNPDSYITEVAEERVELDTMGWEITPDPATYAPIAGYLSAQARGRAGPGVSGAAAPGARSGGPARITQAFRAEYYQLALRVLREQRQVIPCYAGWASAHIAPDGDVWTCCVRAQAAGNLRQTGYDLAPIWSGPQMAALRGSIARGECACPMANASYANMLLHLPTVTRVAAGLLVRR